LNGTSKTLSVLLLLAAVLLAAAARSQPVSPPAAAEASARAAAEAWLALVDQGKYGESWDQAAAYFRKAVSREKWVQSMNAFREPLGKVLERKETSARFASTLPGAPDGAYVVIQFETSFSNKKSAVETVTPMLDPDGQWRVSGYFIR